MRTLRQLLIESTCPACGSPGAYHGLHDVECDNPKCKFFSQKQAASTGPVPPSPQNSTSSASPANGSISPATQKRVRRAGQLAHRKLEDAFNELYALVTDDQLPDGENDFIQNELWGAMDKIQEATGLLEKHVKP